MEEKTLYNNHKTSIEDNLQTPQKNNKAEFNPQNIQENQPPNKKTTAERQHRMQ